MKFNHFLIKDKTKRLKFKKIEYLNLLLKFFVYNRSLSYDLRFFFFIKLSSINKGFSRVQIKNRCIITGRSHSVLRIFKLSRITFKESIGKNIIQGIRKSSW